jgi:hypothetical protein
LATSSPGEHLDKAEQWLLNIASLKKLGGGYKVDRDYRNVALPTVKLLVVQCRSDLHDVLRRLRSPGFGVDACRENVHHWYDNQRLRRQLAEDRPVDESRWAHVRQSQSRERRPALRPAEKTARSALALRTCDEFVPLLLAREVFNQSTPTDEWLVGQLGDYPATWATFFGLFDGWTLSMGELTETSRILTKAQKAVELRIAS